MTFFLRMTFVLDGFSCVAGGFLNASMVFTVFDVVWIFCLKLFGNCMLKVLVETKTFQARNRFLHVKAMMSFFLVYFWS